MSGAGRLFKVTIMLVVLASSSALPGSLADETGFGDPFRGWVLSYCDGEKLDDSIRLEYGACRTAENDYHLVAPGVQSKTIRRGSGRAATQGDLVVVEYIGWVFEEGAEYRRGPVIDSSYTFNRGPFEFRLGAGRVIAGWEKGVEGMWLGEVRELVISPEMAYGNRAIGDLVPPDSTLIFEIELLELSPVASILGFRRRLLAENRSRCAAANYER